MELASSRVSRRLSAQEAAERYGVAERSIRRWIENSELHAEKVGRAFAIDPTELERLLETKPVGRAAARAEELDLQAQLAELRGRYRELQEQFERLQTQLLEEQRRSARLEVKLEAA